MNPMLLGASICSIALLIVVVIRRRSPHRKIAHLILILFSTCGSLVFTALYLIHLHRIKHIHIDHEKALIQAEALVLSDEIFARHGRAKIAIIHRPGEQNEGITLELIRCLEAQGQAILSLEPASMKEGRDASYFKGKALARCLKIEADIFISTCGLPPIEELKELSRFHPDADDEKGDTEAPDAPPLKPLYVLNGNAAKYLPYLKNGAVSGLVTWRSQPDKDVFGFRSLTPRELFDRRYLFIRNDKLADLPAIELSLFNP